MASDTLWQLMDCSFIRKARNMLHSLVFALLGVYVVGLIVCGCVWCWVDSVHFIFYFLVCWVDCFVKRSRLLVCLLLPVQLCLVHPPEN